MQMKMRPTFPEKILTKLFRLLEESSSVIFKSFSDNQFQANSSKSHVLLSTNQHEQVNIGAAQIENSLTKITRCDN